MQEQQKRKNTKDNLSGMNIYSDSKGRKIYSNPFIKEGYLINESDIRNLSSFFARNVVTILVFAVPSIYYGKYVLGALLAAAFYVLSTVFFQKKFFSKLTVIKDFDKSTKETYMGRLAKRPSRSLAINSIVFLCLAVFISVNSLKQKYEGSLMVANILCVIYCIVISGISLVAIIRKKKNGE